MALSIRHYSHTGYIAHGYRRNLVANWFTRSAEAVSAEWCKRSWPAYNLSPVDKTFMLIGSVAALIGVGFGAFGAHADFAGRLSPDMLAVFETGVRYQMYHAFALLITALALARFDGWLLRTAGWLFTAGIVLFSGSLYALALSGRHGARRDYAARRPGVSRRLGLLHHRGDLNRGGLATIKPGPRSHDETPTRTKKNQATESPRHWRRLPGRFGGRREAAARSVLAPRHEPGLETLLARVSVRSDHARRPALSGRPAESTVRRVRFAIVALLFCVSVPLWQ